MSILAAAGAGLGAVTGLVGNNQTNKANIQLQREQQQFNAQQAKQANEWNMQQWQRENEYNAPAQQMARLEAAGLNPNLMYGQGNPGTASKLTAEVPQGVAPAKVSNSLFKLYSMLSTFILQVLIHRNNRYNCIRKISEGIRDFCRCDSLRYFGS